MKYPFKLPLMKIRHTKVQYVIIHHTWCTYQEPSIKIDAPKFQMKKMSNYVMEKKVPDINYHFIVERIGDDFYPFIARPFVLECDFPDIESNMNRKSIHVALLGNYDVDFPEKRTYEVLCYKIINPLLKMFSLSYSRIKFHNEVSSNENETCPGTFVSKNIIEAQARRFIMK